MGFTISLGNKNFTYISHYPCLKLISKENNTQL